MKYTCGNYYINDKSTGSVVGQQPFGDINFMVENQEQTIKVVYFFVFVLYIDCHINIIFFIIIKKCN